MAVTSVTCPVSWSYWVWQGTPYFLSSFLLDHYLFLKCCVSLTSPLQSIIYILHSLCPKFLIGSEPKRLNTSTGIVSFAMIWLSHPCILKINFWYKMAFTLTLIMTCGLNVLNVSIPTMLSAFKNQISAPTMNTSVPLCHVETRFIFVSLLFILFSLFYVQNGSMWREAASKAVFDPTTGEYTELKQRKAVYIGVRGWTHGPKQIWQLWYRSTMSKFPIPHSLFPALFQYSFDSWTDILSWNVSLINILCPFSLCRNNDPKKILISCLARHFRIPKTTLWKWLTGKVVGCGHHSGGRGQPRVLSAGKFTSLWHSRLLGTQIW